MLRGAPRPFTSAEITDARVEARALRTDRDTLVVIRKRIGFALFSMRNAGLTKNDG
jgi:hypothetical protein